MFGFSLQKLLVLVLVVAVVWYGFKFVSRLQQARETDARLRASEKKAGRPAARGREVDEAEEMVQCPVCDAYVAARATSSCGRDDCPY